MIANGILQIFRGVVKNGASANDLDVISSYWDHFHEHVRWHVSGDCAARGVPGYNALHCLTLTDMTLGSQPSHARGEDFLSLDGDQGQSQRVHLKTVNEVLLF